MTRLDDYADSPRGQLIVQRLGDLLGQALLELEPVGEHPDQTGDLAQPDDPALWQIADMAAAEERQHMVLAKAVERDVLDEHHLVVVLVEDSARDDVRRADPVAVGQLPQRPGDPLRSRS